MTAGLTAAWAIFGLFLALDHEMGLEPGALFRMVGIAFGIDTSYAVYIGFLLYMITAVVIGIIYSEISKRIKVLYINSVIKGVGTGILAGVIIWAVLFLPINYLIMQPTLQKMLNESDPIISRIYNGKKTYRTIEHHLLGFIIFTCSIWWCNGILRKACYS